ncbi:MAG: hypothetical protein EAZ24_08245 [Burkholderiales bacterium]|nr:MAG: hypothetical protein EAZ24_08245 [Burkholderiales bacterium]
MSERRISLFFALVSLVMTLLCIFDLIYAQRVFSGVMAMCFLSACFIFCVAACEADIIKPPYPSNTGFLDELRLRAQRVIKQLHNILKDHQL